MFSAFDPGALLARYYVLPRGPRVCLRLARIRDMPGIQELFARHGLAPDELELARLVRADPRRQIVICATALVNGAETIVGVGAIDLERTPGREPEPMSDQEPMLLLVDDRLTDGLEELLADALMGRAQALSRARAG